MGLIGLVFELIVNRIKKDPQIVDCKKRAKEIETNFDHKSKEAIDNLKNYNVVISDNLK